MNKIVIQCIIFALFSYWIANESIENIKPNDQTSIIEDTIISQKLSKISNTPIEVTSIYYKDQLIGYIQDLNSIDKMLIEVYNESYKDIYKDSQLSIGVDLIIIKELTYNIPVYDDQLIVEYLKKNQLYSLKAYRYDFKVDEGTYDSIYVINSDIYNQAQDLLLSTFVSEKALQAFSNNQQLPELTEYGYRELSVSLVQNVETFEVFANPNDILTTKNEVLDFLVYGRNKERKYYTVIEGDTVQGVGAKNGQLSAEQIMAINSETIKSTNQILEPGLLLNVTYYTPIVDVVVHKELIVKEILYPEAPIYLDDANLREGMSRVEVQYKEGTQNTKYNEKWVNGILVDYEKVSSEITSHSQQPVIYRGSKIIPGVGSGIFRFPVDNPHVSCGWGCYPGHSAVDFVNRYLRYAPIYAVDRGTVIQSGYHPVSGNYIIIDHNNGYKTQYNHFSAPAYFPVGVNVDKGEIIGIMGDTGTAFGVHVHLILWENDVRINFCNKIGC